MKTVMSRRGAYIGAGAGVLVFSVFGFLPGSLLGGATGIKLAGMLFGLPPDSGFLSRMIVLASMLLGALVSGAAITTPSTVIGWLIGAALGATASENTFAVAERRRS